MAQLQQLASPFDLQGSEREAIVLGRQMRLEYLTEHPGLQIFGSLMEADFEIAVFKRSV